MPSKFAVRRVRLKVYMTVASPMTLTTNASQTWLLFNLQYLGQYLSYYIQTWHYGRLMHGILMLVLMTLNLALTSFVRLALLVPFSDKMIANDNSHVLAQSSNLRVDVSVLQNSEPSGQRTVLFQSLFSSSTTLITELHYQVTSKTWLLCTFCIVHERDDAGV